MLVQQVHAHRSMVMFSAYDENGTKTNCFFPVLGDKLVRDLHKTGAVTDLYTREWNQSLGFLCRKDPRNGAEPYILFFKRPNETVDEFIQGLANAGIDHIIMLNYSTMRFVSTNLNGLNIFLDCLRTKKENGD